MTRGGKNKTHDAPQRRCIVARDSVDPARLIRFVADPAGVVVPDVLGKLPGRGMWVTADRALLEQAATKGAFSRAAKTQLSVPPGLADLCEQLLAKRVIELMSLARRAGQAIAGYEKVLAALKSGEARVLVQAADGSPGQKSKLRAPEGKRTYLDCMTGQELGLAFGRENVIHAALAGGGLTNRVVDEAARLEGLRGQSPVTRAKSGVEDV